MIVRRNLFVLSVLMLLLSFSVTLTVQAQDTAATCASVVSDALTALGTNCANLSRNTTCFGNEAIAHAAFTEPVPVDFYTQPGDLADLSVTAAIQTGPLDVAQGEWGLNVMNVNANLPADAAGKGVVFVQFGGVEVENDVEPESAVQLPAVATSVTVATQTDLLAAPESPDALAVVPAGAILSVDALTPAGDFARVVFQTTVGWVSTDALDPQVDLSDLPGLSADGLTPMQRFYFRTGIGGEPCAEAPSLLFIQGPNNAAADLWVYDHQVRIKSTIVLRLSPSGDAIELIVLSGLAIINPGTPDEVTVPPGYITTIALSPDPANLGIEGDADERATVGSWSPPRPLTSEELEELGTLEDIPGNIINYEIEIPVIITASSVGGVIPVLVFPNPEALAAAEQACADGLLPDDVCQYLQL